jgi:hypothetical protein
MFFKSVFPKVSCVEIKSHCEILRQWKLNLTMALRGEAFGRCLGLAKVLRVEPSWLNTGGFIRWRVIRRHAFGHKLPVTCHVMFCATSGLFQQGNHLHMWPFDCGPPELWDKKKFFNHFLLLLYWGYIVIFTIVLTIYNSWIHRSTILLYQLPPSILGTVSTGFIFPFSNIST